MNLQNSSHEKLFVFSDNSSDTSKLNSAIFDNQQKISNFSKRKGEWTKWNDYFPLHQETYFNITSVSKKLAQIEVVYH